MTAPSNSGVAGRTDYSKWDRVTSDLVSEVDRQDAADETRSASELGHNSQPRSQAEADEKRKAADAKAARDRLEEYRKREEGVVQVLSGLLLVDNGSSAGDAPRTEYVTRSALSAGRRVLTVSNATGPGSIILTQDLTNLESAVPVNSRATPKRYEGDAENDLVVAEEEDKMRKIYGLIKLNLHDLHDCTVVVRCKVITGTVEISNCTNVVVKVEKDATVVTVQADLCDNLSVEFWDAPSGKNGAAVAGMGQLPGAAAAAVSTMPTRLFWGDDKDDRILHAGVTNLRVATYRDGYVDLETKADYKELGAKSVGNATPQEVQFVTSVVGGDLVTDKVVRGNGTAGGGGSASTGSSARAMTEREVEEERKRKESAPCPENLIRFVDKSGGKGANKAGGAEAASVPSPTSVVAAADGAESSSSSPPPCVVDNDEVVAEGNEIYASMTQERIDSIVKDCTAQKVRGNEAFAAGEYAQAVLLYTLTLDGAAELPDAGEVRERIDDAAAATAPVVMKQLFPRHVVLSNRSASFLKLGEHEKALKDATEATVLDPTYVKAVFRRGLALHAMGRYDEAVPALGAAHKIEPKNKQIGQALRFAEVRLQQEIRKRMEG